MSLGNIPRSQIFGHLRNLISYENIVENSSIETLLVLPKQIKSIPSSKRKEENLKLVFNWAFELLEDRLIKANPTAANSQSLFLSYYFKSVARRTGQSIKCFLRPSLNNIKKNGPRSFNTEFLQAISQSKLFMDDLSAILDNDFLPEMAQIMYERLIETVSLWEKAFHKDPIHAVENTCNKLETSPKLKIPWSMGEVAFARETVLRALKPQAKRRRGYKSS